MKRILFLILILCAGATAQTTIRATTVNSGTITADSVVLSGTGPTAAAGLDASAALHTLPFKVGLVAGLPGTCTVGERYFASNAITVGQNSYSCTAPNVWTLDFGAGIIVSSGTVDFSGAGHTRPAKVGLIAALPALCTVGEVYFATDATPGRNWYFCTALNTWTQQVAGAVTSVAMTVPAFMGIGGSPITTSGTLALTMNNQNQNLFLVGPASGAAATPTFRAIVALDLGTGSATSSTFLRGDLTWAAANPPVASVDLTSQNAAITTTTLYAVPVSGAGQYRLHWNAKVTTVAGTSSNLGALTIVYTDPDGVAQTVTAGALLSSGSTLTTNGGNTTNSALFGIPLLLNCKASTNITYAMAYTSNAANAMNYNLHIKLEAVN